MTIIKQLRNNYGWSQKELADKLFVNQTAVSQWERGATTPSPDTLIAIANVFNVSVDYLLGRDSSTDGIAPPTPSVPGSKWIPVLGDVAAGVPIEAIEDIIDYEEIAPEVARNGDHFALRIKGDSMEPRIKGGDVVIVAKQDSADEGDIAVVLVNGDSATVKKVSFQNGGIMLIPFNPAYQPVFYDRQTVVDKPVCVIGKVIELRAKF